MDDQPRELEIWCYGPWLQMRSPDGPASKVWDSARILPIAGEESEAVRIQRMIRSRPPGVE
jgi:hypothetical protein